MPTYRNNNRFVVQVGGKSLKPGEEIRLLSYDINGSVELIDMAPFFNPIVLAERVDVSKIVKVPERDNLGNAVTRYLVHFYNEGNVVKVWYNSKLNNPPLLLYKGAKWNVRCYERLIDIIVVEFERLSDVGNRLWVIIEKI